jgi:hypothetical protein
MEKGGEARIRIVNKMLYVRSETRFWNNNELRDLGTNTLACSCTTNGCQQISSVFAFFKNNG